MYFDVYSNKKNQKKKSTNFFPEKVSRKKQFFENPKNPKFEGFSMDFLTKSLGFTKEIHWKFSKFQIFQILKKLFFSRNFVEKKSWSNFFSAFFLFEYTSKYIQGDIVSSQLRDSRMLARF